MNVLSLFDGISCLQVALNRTGIEYANYYASEINKHSIKVTQHNFPRTIQLGDVRKIHFDMLPHINLIAAGSPCQDFSSLNKEQKGLAGEKSSLFYYFLKAREKWPNAYFLLENVKGAKELTKILRIKPIKLNSSWVIPQTRPRLYWTNIPVNSYPSRNRRLLSDYLEERVAKSYYQSEAWNKWWIKNKEYQLAKQFSTLSPKIANCLTARMYKSWNGNFIDTDRGIRRLTIKECERLQTLPDGYTSIIPESAAYEAIGNGWTVDIISHILKHIKN